MDAVYTNNSIGVRGYVTVRVDDVVVAEGPNLVVTAGLNQLASALIGADTFSATSWYLELGTGTTAVNAGDTALVTPDTATWRTSSVAEVSSATATLEAFYPTSVANGSWTELALFSGATATAGSGTLFARILTSWSKTSSQTATVSWTVTLSTT